MPLAFSLSNRYTNLTEIHPSNSKFLCQIEAHICIKCTTDLPRLLVDVARRLAVDGDGRQFVRVVHAVLALGAEVVVLALVAVPPAGFWGFG